MPSPQGRYWLLTIPCHDFMPYLPPGVSFLKGQLEQGASGFLHWQLMASFPKKVTCSYVKTIFGTTCHAELSRSSAANEYVWKEDSRVGHMFQLGKLPMKRNSATDWDEVRENAKKGKFDDIPADIFIRSYANLKRIAVDHMQAVPQEKEVYVFWGRTGTGKSRRAWEEATFGAFPKDPCTKWWCGYTGQTHVVIDEFRGQIGISHLLRWLDRYPVVLESKGSSCVSRMEKIWITSNLSPDEWYPDLDEETKSALRRRFTQVIHFN